MICLLPVRVKEQPLKLMMTISVCTLRQLWSVSFTSLAFERLATVMKNLENSGISGKVMEFRLKLRRVIEMLWNWKKKLEQSVMEKSWNWTIVSPISFQIGAAAQQLKNLCKDFGHGILLYYISAWNSNGKVLGFGSGSFADTLCDLNPFQHWWSQLD